MPLAMAVWRRQKPEGRCELEREELLCGFVITINSLRDLYILFAALDFLTESRGR